MTEISVVIPALNDASMLATCLAALANQTRKPDEVIVVDNGSTDDTAAVAVGHGARVILEPQRGIPAATAAGFDAARGDIVARLDADSVPGPDWLARVEARFTSEPDLAALTGPGEFYGAGRLKHRLGETLYIGGYFWSMTWLLGHPPLYGSNFAITAAAWARIRETSHRNVRELHDDLDLSFQFRPGMRVAYDRDLRVGVSARPFGSLRGLGRRLYWAYTTVAVNVREQSLLDRREAHLDWKRGAQSPVGQSFPAADSAIERDPEFGRDELGPELERPS